MKYFSLIVGNKITTDYIYITDNLKKYKFREVHTNLHIVPYMFHMYSNIALLVVPHA